MLRSDGWAEEGWTGTIRGASNGGVSINWDNGKRLSHLDKDVALLGAKDNPNVAFRIQKYNKKGNKS